MFQVKVYDRTNTTLKKVISPKDIISDISFSMNLWGWLWQQNIQIAYDINDTTFDLWDLVKIKEYNEKNKSWRQIYMWYISKIWRLQTETRQLISLTCLWVASLLTEFKTNYSYISANAWDVIKWLIDQFNASYGTIFNYTFWTSIESWPSIGSGNIDWNYLEIIKNISNRAWYDFFIDAEATVYFTDPDNATKHDLTNQKDVERISIFEDIEWLVNSVEVEATFYKLIWSDKVEVLLESSYNDATSVDAYWERKKTVNIRANTQSYVDDYAEQYVNDRKDPKKETIIVVNRKFNLEIIKPWDKIKIRNFEYPFDWIKIIKINYTPDRATLYLDRYVSFGWEIKQTWN